ncbi:MAG: hypothetical protein ABSC94_06495 [Polyangiaceae bacterium]|jgi:hypothetical protein
MRPSTFLGGLAITTFATNSHAEDVPLQAPSPAATAASPQTPDRKSVLILSAPPADPLEAEVARQGAAIDALRALIANEKREAHRPEVRFSGFIQADWVIHNQESQNEINGSGEPLNQDRFTLRRGHLRVDAEQGLVLGAVEIDANTTNGPQLRPIDAEVSLRWPDRADDRLPSLMASIGLMRIPFGYEVQELDWVRPFLERATMLEALFPGEFDLGVRLKVKYRFIDWALGMMNGSPIGDKIFPDLDPVQAKDLVGRLGADVEIAPGVRFQAGISADTGTGFHAGTPATKSQLVWQDENGDGVVQSNEITAIGGTPASPSQVFHRFALGCDVRLMVRLAPLGDLSLRVEALDALNLDRGLEVADPIGAGHNLREMGYAVGATQEVTRWALVGVRYDLYNPDADASENRAANLVPINRSYSTLALMGMLRYGAGARLLLEYDINRNPLGIGANGAPTTLADNVLTLRGQVVF